MRQRKNPPTQKINVELVKTRAKNGHTLHRIKLKGAVDGTRISDFISEGENRVIALAVFLADVTGKTPLTPFIFDDPISSLDQDYEENTMQRTLEDLVSQEYFNFLNEILKKHLMSLSQFIYQK